MLTMQKKLFVFLLFILASPSLVGRAAADENKFPEITIGATQVRENRQGELELFSRVENRGPASLTRVEVRIYCLYPTGKVISQWLYQPVDAQSKDPVVHPRLAPGESRRFRQVLPPLPGDWEKDVYIEVTQAETVAAPAPPELGQPARFKLGFGGGPTYGMTGFNGELQLAGGRVGLNLGLGRQEDSATPWDWLWSAGIRFYASEPDDDFRVRLGLHGGPTLIQHVGSLSTTIYGIQGLCGFQWFWFDNLSLDLDGGINIPVGLPPEQFGTSSETTSSFCAAGGFTLHFSQRRVHRAQEDSSVYKPNDIEGKVRFEGNYETGLLTVGGKRNDAYQGSVHYVFTPTMSLGLDVQYTEKPLCFIVPDLGVFEAPAIRVPAVNLSVVARPQVPVGDRFLLTFGLGAGLVTAFVPKTAISPAEIYTGVSALFSLGTELFFSRYVSWGADLVGRYAQPHPYMNYSTYGAQTGLRLYF